MDGRFTFVGLSPEPRLCPGDTRPTLTISAGGYGLGLRRGRPRKVRERPEGELVGFTYPGKI
jgi:hypothetical protein